MFFTQEDFRKIEQWLQRKSVKDTEFQDTDYINDKDILVVVQDGQNKRIFIRDLITQIFKLEVADIINVSDKYKRYNINLEEAIKLIPYQSRKAGQLITFLDFDNEWKVYQFKGITNQWNIIDLWECLVCKNSGKTEERPINPNIGFQYFDTTITKPIWWAGDKWVDATGNNI